MDQHQHHWRPHQRKRLEDVLPGERAAAQVGEIPRHRKNQNQLHPLRGLKLHVADLDPAPRTQHLDAEDPHRNQRQQAHPIGPWGEVDQLVVVDAGKDEHGYQPARDPVDLLGVEAHVLGVQRGRVDLQHGKGAEH